MLNKKISFDEEVAKLSLKTALLYTWCIPNLDVEGRILANFDYLKGNIVPYRKDFSVKVIKKCVEELGQSSIVLLYGNSYKYMQFLGFNKNQSIKKDREAPSEIPAPTPAELLSNSCVTPAKYNISKDNISKGNIKDIERVTQEFFSYFLLKTKKDFKLTSAAKDLISQRLKDGYTLEQMKLAVDNFVQDDWPERQKHLDLIYCIGKQKGKPDNLEKWLNVKPKKVVSKIEQPEPINEEEHARVSKLIHETVEEMKRSK